MGNLLFRPTVGVAADFIPFYWQGDYHLFYLQDYRSRETYGEGTPWQHLVTRDFAHFADWGEALPRGTPEEQDLYVFTGSVCAAEGQFHIFYTGHNPYFRRAGQPEQAILHTTSPDLRTWTKDREFRFTAPAALGYEPHDWRDPFVYWDERFAAYGMLLAARRTGGPSRNRGCTALATSPDLRTWTVREPFWAPDEYFTHECPDLFRLGDWWYLVYSTFTERCVTHYRMARSLSGPWLASANDTFDGRAYYATKTAGDGERRFSFGWLPTRSGDQDDGAWQWGGELVVHELFQRPDGTLAAVMPETVAAAFRPAERQLRALQAVLGEWEASSPLVTTDAVGRHALLDLGDLAETALIETDFTFAAGLYAGGLLLRADADYERYYVVRVEPAQQRLVIDRWPRPGDQPWMLERPLPLTPGQPVHLRVLVDGTNLVVYADGVALSCRMYTEARGRLGLFVTEGQAQFTWPHVRELAASNSLKG